MNNEQLTREAFFRHIISSKQQAKRQATSSFHVSSFRRIDYEQFRLHKYSPCCAFCSQPARKQARAELYLDES